MCFFFFSGGLSIAASALGADRAGGAQSLLRTPGGSLLWHDAGGMGREASEDDATAEPPPTEEEEEEQEEDAARSAEIAAEIARSREERGGVGGVTLWGRGRKGKEGGTEEEAVVEEKEQGEGEGKEEEEEEEEEGGGSPVREATTPGRMAFTPGGRVRAALSPIPQEVGRPRDAEEGCAPIDVSMLLYVCPRICHECFLICICIYIYIYMCVCVCVCI